RWWKFCHLTDTDVFKATIPDVLRFLAGEFDKGSAYGTLNSTRPAVALILGPVIGQDAQVKRFCKGASRLRPSQPKYDATWDPQIVLNFLGKWFPYDKKQPTLVLPVFKENPSICVVTALDEYLVKTKPHRTSDYNLFISWRKPHKSVTSQTLSRWIKTVMEQSGIDITIFTAYSTRHAATSAAKASGINIDFIRKTAGWTQKSKTFAKFYDRKVVQDPKIFAEAVFTKINKK
ncbi:GSCOCG00011608001-RA-CDS, partial [Cotesia congregata]